MMSIILAVILLFGGLAIWLPSFLSLFTTYYHINEVVWSALISLYVVGFSYWILNISSFLTDSILDFLKRNTEISEVEGTVRKREFKKRFLKEYYKVTITYEDLEVTIDNSTLFHTCRENENIHMILRTRNHNGEVIRTLSIS